MAIFGVAARAAQDDAAILARLSERPRAIALEADVTTNDATLTGSLRTDTNLLAQILDAVHASADGRSIPRKAQP